MTRKEFSGQYARLCKGFKFEATPEQAEAWFARIGHTHMQDWSEAVTTLLCGKYYPKLDEALEEIERRAEHRRRMSVTVERDAARQTLKQVGISMREALADRPDLLEKMERLMNQGVA